MEHSIVLKYALTCMFYFLQIYFLRSLVSNERGFTIIFEKKIGAKDVISQHILKNSK